MDVSRGDLRENVLVYDSLSKVKPDAGDRFSIQYDFVKM